LIVDVRTWEEIKKMDLPELNTSHAKVPKFDLELKEILNHWLDDIEKYKKSHYLLCLCAHGIRSALATEVLWSKGFQTANISGGISDLEGHIELKAS